MTSEPAILQRFLNAVDALNRYFKDHPQLSKGEESHTEYGFTNSIEIKKGWDGDFSALARELLKASFTLTITVVVGGYETEFSIGIKNADGNESLEASCTRAEEIVGNAPPDEAVPTFEAFQQLTKRSSKSGQPLVVTEVFTAINSLTAQGAKVAVTISASLSKNQIEPEAGSLSPGATLQKVAYYLFAENLVKELETKSLEGLENDFCERDKRTVIVLFDSSDFLSGDLLTICGRGHENELRDSLIQPPPKEVLDATRKTLDFRKSEILGDFQTQWITPDFFDLSGSPAEANGTLASLCNQLSAFQTLLSALFMGDYIERCEDGYRVEYRGIRVTKLCLNPKLFLNQTAPGALRKLYAYAYEGFSADKLEIVQQFLSLMVGSVDALWSKAVEIREAAEKNYAIVLRDKVSVYFDALNKIEDRIKTAVDKFAESVINLSRDLSGDLYKVGGLIAAAIAGALLKPDFGWLVALAASSVIALYLWLVIFYYLSTLKSTYDLSNAQHTGFIDSFTDILGPTKIKGFHDDDHLKQARDLYAERLSAAEQIYVSVLILCLLIVEACTYKLGALYVHS